VLPSSSNNPFESWYAALERRHLSSLTFGEVRRAVTALSSIYVERRSQLSTGAALDGRGKRAAFALFYSPLHFLTIQGIVRHLRIHAPPPERILDLGCGTGVAGAAWAIETQRRPDLIGIDRNEWAVEEARWTYASLELRGSASRGRLEELPHARAGDAILAAFTVNEMEAEGRDRLLPRLLDCFRQGASILVVEPIARRGFPWWNRWTESFQSLGGRQDEWRFPANLPETLNLFSKASGLDHRELKAKSLWLPAAGRRPITSSSRDDSLPE